MNELVLMPTTKENRSRFNFADAEVVEPIAEVNTKQSSVSFLDANTNAVTLEELSSSCVGTNLGQSRVNNLPSGFYLLRP